MMPRPLIIAGMPRSGTSLLRRLCNGHPQMRVTAEFGNYQFAGRPFAEYAQGVARRLWLIKGRWPIDDDGRVPARSRLDRTRKYLQNVLTNGTVATAHLLRLAKRGPGPVTLGAIVAATEKRPETRIVGDKLPQYILRMPRLAKMPNLLRVVIYRDCRDVTSSYLRKVRGDWEGTRWAQKSGTAEALAHKWVHMIGIMEQFAGSVFIVRYEDLVQTPELELRRLAEWLSVDPDGFTMSSVFESSIGNYQRGLSPQELADVQRIAGPTLERLGYPLDEPVLG